MKTIKFIIPSLLFMTVLLFVSCEEEESSIAEEELLLNEQDPNAFSLGTDTESINKLDLTPRFTMNRYNTPGVQKFGYRSDRDFSILTLDPRDESIGETLGQELQGRAFRTPYAYTKGDGVLPSYLRRLSAVKLYILSSPDLSDIIMTTDISERDRLLYNGWTNKSEFRGVLYDLNPYISNKKVRGTVALYRFNHTPTGRHFYTADIDERTAVLNSGDYVEEGIVGYVVH